MTTEKLSIRMIEVLYQEKPESFAAVKEFYTPEQVEMITQMAVMAGYKIEIDDYRRTRFVR